MKTIILTGMMGAGKSAVGQSLAQRLSCDYLDLDTVIEKKEGISVSDIFKIHGEQYFRNSEYNNLMQIFKPENMVISLGGGTFENGEIRNYLLNSAVVVYLETSPETVFDRIKTDTSRPLLKSNMSVSSIEKIMDARKENYKLATYTVITDNKTVNDVVLEIIKCVS